MKTHLALLGLIFATMIGCCGWIANAALPDSRIIDATEYNDTVAMIRTALEGQDHAANAAMVTEALIGARPAPGETLTITAGEFNRNFGEGGALPKIKWRIAENAFLRQSIPAPFEGWMFRPTDAEINPHIGVSPAVPDATNAEEFRYWWRRMLRLRK